MTRTRLTILGLTLLAVVATTLWAAVPEANASTLASQLRTSERELREANADLDEAHAALATALAEHRRRGLGTLILVVNKAKHAVAFWKEVVADLRAQRARERQAATAASRGDWKELITQAARTYGVSADGLYRLMIMESGGRPGVVSSGKFYGLYQYALVTWRGDWNPWRGASVFDGGAQIRATAVAVKKGMGRALWANTYAAAF